MNVASEVPKVKNMSDTFEKAKQHLNDGLFEKAMMCYSEVVCETLAQVRTVCFSCLFAQVLFAASLVFDSA